MRDIPKRVKISLISAVSLYLIVLLNPAWSRLLPSNGNTFMILIAFVLALLLIGLALYSLILIFFNKNYNKAVSYLPIIIAPLIFYISFFAPFKIDLDKLYGKISYQACYEGTMNQATLKLRGEDKIEIRWTGVFFSDDYFEGTYSQNYDTLYIDFRNEKAPRNFGNKAILKKGEGITWFDNENKLLDKPFFYEGKCKGLN